MIIKFPVLILVIVVLLVSCAAVFAVYVAGSDYPADLSGTEKLFVIERGESVTRIAHRLENEGFVRNKWYIVMRVRLENRSLKAGAFYISSAQPSSRIIEILHAGKSADRRVTIPEGMSIKKTARHLERESIIDGASFIAAAHDPVFVRSLGVPSDSVEGYLFPDTYQFGIGSDAKTIITTMVKNFFVKIRTLESLPSDPDELHRKVILASIIEREYRVESEAPLISSVFTNRLKIGMGLYSCATVEYIITEIQGRDHPSRLTNDDLAIQSDYNTYLWAGLPPGPISNPGLIALSASFSPEKTPFLYFRLNDPVQGTHTFTRSFDEHRDTGRDIYLKKAAGN